MATELENRFIINNEECQYAVDTTPVENSTAFLSSGGAYEWYNDMQPYRGRAVVNTTSDFVENSTNIPTVGLIYKILKDNNVI